MEHPLIDNIDHLSVDELTTKINELTRKYNWARRHNAHLANQIAMALETFRNKQAEKYQAMIDAQKKDAPDFSDRIDIS